MSEPRANVDARRRPAGSLAGPLLLACLGLCAGCDDFRPPGAQSTAPAAPAALDAGGTEPPQLPFAMEQAQLQGDPRLTYAGVGRAHVFVPDPVDHAVSVVALADGSVREVRAGQRPDFLAVAPGRDLAIALDVGSDAAHVIEVIDGEIRASALQVVARANAIAFTDDGRYAVVYFDARNRLAAEELPTHEGLSVIDLGPKPSATEVDMGLSPTRIGLSSAPPRAYLQRGTTLARIDLDDPAALAQPIDTGAQGARVTLFAHAGLALSMQPGGDSLTLIDLEARERHALFLDQLDPGVPDADAGTLGDASIADAIVDAEGEHVVVAVPERDRLLRLQWPLILDDPGALTRSSLPMSGPQRLVSGQGGTLAILGGQAGEGPHTVSLWSADDPGATLRYALPSAAIDAVSLAHGDAVLVEHEDGYSVASRAAAASTYRRAAGPPSAAVQAHGELFAIAADQAAPGAAPAADGNAPDAAMPAAAPTTDARRASIDRISLDSLEAARQYLDSPPRALGATPDGQYLVIDQAHPSGRVTILDLAAGTRRTLTGFHLTDRVTE